MRLTLLNQFYTPDIAPTAHLTASLAEHRAAEGDEVTVIASRGGYVAPAGSKRDAAEGQVNVHRVWTPQVGKQTKLRRLIDWGTFYLLAFWKMLTLPRQDVIISLTTPPYIAWAAVVHKLLHPHTKIVLWNMDCYPDAAERTGVIRHGGLISRAMRAMNRALFRQVDHLVCLDTAMAELLISQYSPPDRPVPMTIIPNWEDASFFPADARPGPWEDPAAVRIRDRFVVLYLGNTGYGHEFDTIMEVAEALRSEPVVFLFVGGGSRWTYIQKETKRRGLANVILHGYVPKKQTPAVMAASDCALITLQDFALGVMSPSKLHANLAMGLPIIYIGPPGSNVDDAIQQFGCGMSARTSDVYNVTDFIKRLLADPNRRTDLRRRARAAFDLAYCDVQTLPAFDYLLEGLHQRAARMQPASAGPRLSQA